MTERFQQRMYVIVMRHLSGIQKGIQAAHAIVEYANLHHSTTEYQQWSEEDKTLIVLEAGTTEDLGNAGLKINEIGEKYATFREPDLGNIVTAIAFLADERVYDSKKFTDDELLTEKTLRIALMREFKKRFPLASN